MLISCPKCNSVYVVDANKIPENGKKFKCAECSTVWVAEKKDLFDAENKVKVQRGRTNSVLNDDNENVRKMFEMFGQDKKGLFINPSEERISNKEIRQKKRTLKEIIKQYQKPLIDFSIILVILILSGFIFYYNRYTVADVIPLTENIYKKFNVDCLYFGRDLKFSDVTAKYITKSGKHYIEIHGNIKNDSDYKIQIPPIRATISEPNGKRINEVIRNSVMPTVDAHFNSLFRILVETIDDKEKVLSLSFLSKREYDMRK